MSSSSSSSEFYPLFFFEPGWRWLELIDWSRRGSGDVLFQYLIIFSLSLSTVRKILASCRCKPQISFSSPFPHFFSTLPHNLPTLIVLEWLQTLDFVSLSRSLCYAKESQNLIWCQNYRIFFLKKKRFLGLPHHFWHSCRIQCMNNL